VERSGSAHLSSPVPPMPRTLGLIPFSGPIQGDQDGEGPGPRRARQGDEYRDNNPLRSISRGL